MNFKIIRAGMLAAAALTSLACQPHKPPNNKSAMKPTTAATPATATAPAEPQTAIPDITLKPEIVPSTGK